MNGIRKGGVWVHRETGELARVSDFTTVWGVNVSQEGVVILRMTEKLAEELRREVIDLLQGGDAYLRQFDNSPTRTLTQASFVDAYRPATLRDVCAVIEAKTRVLTE